MVDLVYWSGADNLSVLVANRDCRIESVRRRFISRLDGELPLASVTVTCRWSGRYRPGSSPGRRNDTDHAGVARHGDHTIIFCIASWTFDVSCSYPTQLYPRRIDRAMCLGSACASLTIGALGVLSLSEPVVTFHESRVTPTGLELFRADARVQRVSLAGVFHRADDQEFGSPDSVVRASTGPRLEIDLPSSSAISPLQRSALRTVSPSIDLRRARVGHGGDRVPARLHRQDLGVACERQIGHC